MYLILSRFAQSTIQLLSWQQSAIQLTSCTSAKVGESRMIGSLMVFLHHATQRQLHNKNDQIYVGRTFSLARGQCGVVQVESIISRNLARRW